MTSSDRDTRLSEASSLNDAISALVGVDRVQRQSFVHDRIMVAIDDTCAKNKDASGTPAFTDPQMAVIRDVAHQIVYILDPINKRRGFLAGLASDWKHNSSFDKVKVSAAVAVFVWGVATGAYEVITRSWGYFHPATPSTATPPSTKQAPQ